MDNLNIYLLCGYIGTIIFAIGAYQKERKIYLWLFLIKNCFQLIYYIGINDQLVSFVTSMYISLDVYTIYSLYYPNKYEDNVYKYAPFLMALLIILNYLDINGLIISFATILYGFSLTVSPLKSKYLNLIVNTLWFSYGVFYNLPPLILVCTLLFISNISSIFKIIKIKNKLAIVEES